MWGGPFLSLMLVSVVIGAGRKRAPAHRVWRALRAQVLYGAGVALCLLEPVERGSDPFP